MGNLSSKNLNQFQNLEWFTWLKLILDKDLGSRMILSRDYLQQYLELLGTVNDFSKFPIFLYPTENKPPMNPYFCNLDNIIPVLKDSKISFDRTQLIPTDKCMLIIDSDYTKSIPEHWLVYGYKKRYGFSYHSQESRNLPSFRDKLPADSPLDTYRKSLNPSSVQVLQEAYENNLYANFYDLPFDGRPNPTCYSLLIFDEDNKKIEITELFTRFLALQIDVRSLDILVDALQKYDWRLFDEDMNVFTKSLDTVPIWIKIHTHSKEFKWPDTFNQKSDIGFILPANSEKKEVDAKHCGSNTFNLGEMEDGNGLTLWLFFNHQYHQLTTLHPSAKGFKVDNQYEYNPHRYLDIDLKMEKDVIAWTRVRAAFFIFTNSTFSQVSADDVTSSATLSQVKYTSGDPIILDPNTGPSTVLAFYTLFQKNGIVMSLDKNNLDILVIRGVDSTTKSTEINKFLDQAIITKLLDPAKTLVYIFYDHKKEDGVPRLTRDEPHTAISVVNSSSFCFTKKGFSNKYETKGYEINGMWPALTKNFDYTGLYRDQSIWYFQQGSFFLPTMTSTLLHACNYDPQIEVKYREANGRLNLITHGTIPKKYVGRRFYSIIPYEEFLNTRSHFQMIGREKVLPEGLSTPVIRALLTLQLFYAVVYPLFMIQSHISKFIKLKQYFVWHISPSDFGVHADDKEIKIKTGEKIRLVGWNAEMTDFVHVHKVDLSNLVAKVKNPYLSWAYVPPESRPSPDGECSFKQSSIYWALAIIFVQSLLGYLPEFLGSALASEYSKKAQPDADTIRNKILQLFDEAYKQYWTNILTENIKNDFRTWIANSLATDPAKRSFFGKDSNYPYEDPQKLYDFIFSKELKI